MNDQISSHLAFAKTLANLLDDKFSFGGIRFGLDPILDLIPGLGDILANIIGLYIVFVAREIGLPQGKLFQMLVNIALDFLIGLVPVAGEVATIFYRSNRKNIKIIEDYLTENKDTVEDAEIVS